MIQLAPRIVVDERVRFGKPVIEGTRVPVDVVLGKLAAGMTSEAVARSTGSPRRRPRRAGVCRPYGGRGGSARGSVGGAVPG